MQRAVAATTLARKVSVWCDCRSCFNNNRPVTSGAHRNTVQREAESPLNNTTDRVRFPWLYL
eukprot:2616183-Pleurochrysis_carterae.AAC.1